MTEFIEVVESGPEWLADGGFAPDTEIMTTDGPVPVAELECGMHVYAVSPVTRVVKRKPVVAVDSVDPEFAWTTLTGRRFDFRLRPGQPVLYHTKGNDRPRFRRADTLGEQKHYRFLNEWTRGWGGPIAQVDVREWLDEYEIQVEYEGHGHSFRAALPEGCTPIRGTVRDGYFFDAETFAANEGDIRAVASSVGIVAGKHHRRQPLVLPGTPFLRLLAWFATEGSVSWPTNRDTGQIKIAQATDASRDTIAALCDDLGIPVRVVNDGVRFGSKLYGRLLERLCGSGARTKRLPGFLWAASTDQLLAVREVLLAGDGNDRGTFYTVSLSLRDAMMRLCVATGIKPRYSNRGDIWQVYLREGTDGFRTDHHLGRWPAHRPAYRLAVADYPTVIAGRNGKFQWIGTSGVG